MRSFPSIARVKFMMPVPTLLRAFWDCESGVTAIEYALLASLIAVAIVGAISATGTSLGVLYTYWSTAVIAAL